MPKCRKVRWPTRIQAKIALANTQAKDHETKRLYWCKECHAFHITSKGVTRTPATQPKKEESVMAGTFKPRKPGSGTATCSTCKQPYHIRDGHTCTQTPDVPNPETIAPR